jgi:hypothetical protein
MDELLPETLRIVDEHALPMTLFTADADAGIVDGHTYSAVDLGRMRDANASWSARRRRGVSTADSSGWWGAGFFGGGGGGCGGGGCGGGGCGGGG